MQNEVVDSHVSQIQDVGSVFANRTGQTSTDSQYDHHHHHDHHSQQQNGLESSSHGIDNDDEDGLDQDFDMDDEEHEHNSAGPTVWNLNFMDPNYMLWDANQNLRIQSLPILDNLVRFLPPYPSGVLTNRSLVYPNLNDTRQRALSGNTQYRNTT